MSLKLLLQVQANSLRGAWPASKFHTRAGEEAEDSTAANREIETPGWIGRPASWGEVLAGMLPFLIYGLAYWIVALDEWNRLPPPLQGHGWYAPLAAYLLIAIGLGVGWVEGFPRWAYAYLGVALNLGFVYSNGSFYGTRYGWKAWLPLLAAAAVALLLTRSLRPLSSLVRGAWNDWTRLSFVLYAALLPLFTTVFMDGKWKTPPLAGLALDTLLLGAGAAAYLRSRTRWSRAAVLQAAMFLLAARNVLFGDWYRDMDGSLIHSLNPTVLLIPLFWGGLMFLPGILDLMRRGSKDRPVA